VARELTGKKIFRALTLKGKTGVSKNN